jgi:hypothetical protein
MSNKKLCTLGLILFLVMAAFLFSYNPAFGKSSCSGSHSDCCWGSGKYSLSVFYCGSSRFDCAWYPPCYENGDTCGGNCLLYYDPAFPSFEYKSSTIGYLTEKYEIVLLLSILSFFFALLSVLKGQLFILDFMSRIFKIRPQIIQTKCKQYNSYWLRKFKKYL